MSQSITGEKLTAFAEAVIKAAHEHLGANGVIGVAVGLNYDTYNATLAEYLKSDQARAVVNLATDQLHHGWTYGGFVTVKYVESWGAFNQSIREIR
jgi:hypothetical protein